MTENYTHFSLDTPIARKMLPEFNLDGCARYFCTMRAGPSWCLLDLDAQSKIFLAKVLT